MARQRDYAAEYARRVERAKAAGFSGYWQQRQSRAEVSRAIKEGGGEKHPYNVKGGDLTSRDRVMLRDQLAIALVALKKNPDKRLDPNLVENIRKTLKGKDDVFYPTMRSLYGKVKGKA